MSRIRGHVVSMLAVALVGSAAIPACATNDESIFVRAMLAPSLNRQNGSCTYTNDPTQPQLFEGTLDLGVRDNYFGIVLVGNQMITRGDPAQTRAESNRVHLLGAVVRVTEPDGTLIREFTSYASGIGDTQQNNQPGYGLMGVALIDAPTKDALAPLVPNRQASHQVLANVKAFGKTLGGTDIESGEYQFPIRVCNGCLVNFANGNDPAVAPQPNCAKPLETTGGGSALPCYPGQDESTPCQLCQGRPACDPANP